MGIVINEFKRKDNGTYNINLDIVCEKANHKAILIGKQGRAIKKYLRSPVKEWKNSSAPKSF